MSKFKTVFAILFITLFSFVVSAQKKDSTQTKWNIVNCVNQFSKDKAVPTKVGYQYWFADKDFINGRTLKMSVVAPHDATHPPHKHVED